MTPSSRPSPRNHPMRPRPIVFAAALAAACCVPSPRGPQAADPAIPDRPEKLAFAPLAFASSFVTFFSRASFDCAST